MEETFDNDSINFLKKLSLSIGASEAAVRLLLSILLGKIKNFIKEKI